MMKNRDWHKDFSEIPGLQKAGYRHCDSVLPAMFEFLLICVQERSLGRILNGNIERFFQYQVFETTAGNFDKK